MTRLIIGLVALLLAAAWLASNFRAVTSDVRATIAEPATSTTSVIATGGLAASNTAATGALGTAHIILQATLCVIPLALLVVIALCIVAFIVARKNQGAPQPTQAMQPRPSPLVMIERAPSAPALPSPSNDAKTLAPRRRRVSRGRANGAAKIAGRWFR